MTVGIVLLVVVDVLGRQGSLVVVAVLVGSHDDGEMPWSHGR